MCVGVGVPTSVAVGCGTSVAVAWRHENCHVLLGALRATPVRAPFASVPVCRITVTCQLHWKGAPSELYNDGGSV